MFKLRYVNYVRHKRIFFLPISSCNTPVQKLGLLNYANFLEETILVCPANRRECHWNDCVETHNQINIEIG